MMSFDSFWTSKTTSELWTVTGPLGNPSSISYSCIFFFRSRTSAVLWHMLLSTIVRWIARHILDYKTLFNLPCISGGHLVACYIQFIWRTLYTDPGKMFCKIVLTQYCEEIWAPFTLELNAKHRYSWLSPLGVVK